MQAVGGGAEASDRAAPPAAWSPREGQSPETIGLSLTINRAAP